MKITFLTKDLIALDARPFSCCSKEILLGCRGSSLDPGPSFRLCGEGGAIEEEQLRSIKEIELGSARKGRAEINSRAYVQRDCSSSSSEEAEAIACWKRSRMVLAWSTDATIALRKRSSGLTTIGGGTDPSNETTKDVKSRARAMHPKPV